MARKVEHTFDVFEATGRSARGLDSKSDTMGEIVDFIKEQILDRVGGGKSPVKGESFPRLNAKYAKDKKGGNRTPNLELTGKMLDALEVTRKGSNVTVRISGGQGDKADGHNNHSGESDLPRRRFIPADNQEFNRQILSGIKAIIDSHKEGE